MNISDNPEDDLGQHAGSHNQARLTVVVSSTILDLPDHRAEVCEACLSTNTFPSMMEHLPASSADAMQVSYDLVDSAHVYVGIFAHRYGHLIDARGKSITELEYERAVARGIPRLIFLMDEKHPLIAGEVEVGEGRERIENFKARLKLENTCRSFKSPVDLRALAIQALSVERAKLQGLEGRADAVLRAVVQTSHSIAGGRSGECELSGLASWIPAMKRRTAIAGGFSLLGALGFGAYKLLEGDKSPEKGNGLIKPNDGSSNSAAGASHELPQVREPEGSVAGPDDPQIVDDRESLGPIEVSEAVRRLAEMERPTTLVRIVPQRVGPDSGWLGEMREEDHQGPTVVFVGDYDEMRTLPFHLVAEKLGQQESSSQYTVFAIRLDLNPKLDPRPATTRQFLLEAKNLNLIESRNRDYKVPPREVLGERGFEWPDDELQWCNRYSEQLDEAFEILKSHPKFNRDFPAVHSGDEFAPLGYTRRQDRGGLTTKNPVRVNNFGARSFLVRNAKLTSVHDVRMRHIQDVKEALPSDPWSDSNWMSC